jgi:PKD repeat protein
MKVGMFVFILVLVQISSAVQLHVPDEYQTIQSAIDASATGDSVIVSPGNYAENVEVYEKELTLGSLYLLTGDESYIADTVISGASDIGRIIYWHNSLNCLMSGFTVTRTEQFNGRLLYVLNSGVDLDHVSFRDMDVEPSEALIRISSSDVTLGNTLVSNITSYQTDMNIIMISGNSNFDIYDSEISGNVSECEDGRILQNTTANTLNLENVYIIDNNLNGINWVGDGVFQNLELIANTLNDHKNGIIIDGSFTINDSEISGFGGRGVFATGGETEINNTEICGNGWSGGYDGAGIYIDGADVSISGCSITDNNGTNGGGIYGSECDLYISNSDINDNSASEHGGGIYNFSSYPEEFVFQMDDCEINDNGAGYKGGGFYIRSFYLNITGCEISRNQASQNNGGGDINGVFTVVDSCQFYENFAGESNTRCTGLSISGYNGEISSCVFGNNFAPGGYTIVCGGSSFHLDRCLIYGSSLAIRGMSEIILTNCTVTNNGVGIKGQMGRVYLVNTIMKNNGVEIYYEDMPVPWPPGYATVHLLAVNSDLEDGIEGVVYEVYEFVIDNQSGLITEDPLFVNESADDYSLQEGSPCIDSGTSSFYWDEGYLVYMSPDEYWGDHPDMGAIEMEYGVAAGFSADSVNGEIPFNVSFTDETLGEAESWDWDFDCDGLTDSNEQNPVYTYTQIGIFDVSLRVVQGEYEDIIIKEDYITVGNDDAIWLIPAEIDNIQEAINLAQDGDTLLVAPGVYCENLLIDDKNLLLASEYYTTGDESFINDTILNSHADEHSLISIYNANGGGSRVCGFTISGSAGLCGGGIRVESSEVYLDHLQIDNCQALWGGGIYLEDSEAQMESITFRENSALRGAGFWLDNSSCTAGNIEIYDNNGDFGAGFQLRDSELFLRRGLIYDNISADEGVIVNDNSTLFMEKSTLYCEDSESIGLYNIANSNLILVNNILVTGQEYVIAGDDADSLYISYCCIPLGEAALAPDVFENTVWSAGNLVLDPGFAGEQFNGGMLNEASPCIDMGVTYLEYNNEILVDYSELEYIGSAPDIGYWEYGMDSSINEQIPEIVMQMVVYPNPFNPVTDIRYFLKEQSKVELNIYNIKGCKVRALVSCAKPSGWNTSRWTGENDKSQMVSSGIYLVQLKIDGKPVASSKVCLLK